VRHCRRGIAKNGSSLPKPKRGPARPERPENSKRPSFATNRRQRTFVPIPERRSRGFPAQHEFVFNQPREARDTVEEPRDVRLVGKNGANRLRDFGRGEASGGHLIEQRLKQVVILLVKECDARRAAIERLAKQQAAETCARNDNVRVLGFHLGNNLKYAVNKNESA
jgi:hypothetical protein